MTTEEAIMLKTCSTCKHKPPEKKFPCVDCDMREPADRWEAEEPKQPDSGSTSCKNEEKMHDRTTGDLISRQAAVEELWKALYDYEDKTEKQFQESDELDVCDWIQHRIFVQNMSDIDRQVIQTLPSAQPERKTGKWTMNERQIYWRCNQCNRLSMYRTNFCPDCGADMRGEQNERFD